MEEKQNKQNNQNLFKMRFQIENIEINCLKDMINKIFNTPHISKPFLKKKQSCLVNTIFAQSIDIFRGGRLPLRQSLIAALF